VTLGVTLDWGFHEIHGENLGLNCLFLKNLRCARKMAVLFGDTKLAAHYQERIRQMEEHLRQDYWNEEDAVFSETLVEGGQSALATEFSVGIFMEEGLAEREQVDQMVGRWIANPNLVQFSGVQGLYYTVEGLIRYGHVEFALRLLRKRMAIFFNQGFESLGESWNMFGYYHDGVWRTMNSRSAAQMTSCWPALVFARHLAGVQPELGTRDLVRIAPLPVVQSMQARAYGIDIEWERAKERWYLSARFPKEMKVELTLPFALSRMDSVLVNGKNVGVTGTVLSVDPQERLDVQVCLN